MPVKATYEYNTIVIPTGSAPAVISAALTAEGADGWRLVNVAMEASTGDHYAHFEKKTTTLFDSNGIASA